MPGPNEKKIQILFVRPYAPAFPALIRRFTEKGEHEVVECPTPNDAVELARHQPETLILCHARDTQDIVKLLVMLKLLRGQISKMRTRVLMTSVVIHDGLFAQLRTYGVSEVVPEPVAEKKLWFRVDWGLRAIRQLIDREATAATAAKTWKTGASHGEDGKAVAANDSFQIIEPTRLAEDFWILGDNRPKRVVKRWTLSLGGPSSNVGKWEEVTPPGAHDQAWQWIPLDTRNDPFLGDAANRRGAWVFRGFMPRLQDTTWVFIGTNPELSFVSESGQSIGSRFSLRSDELMIAGDLKESVAKFEPMIAETYAKLIRTDARKLDAVAEADAVEKALGEAEKPDAKNADYRSLSSGAQGDESPELHAGSERSEPAEVSDRLLKDGRGSGISAETSVLHGKGLLSAPTDDREAGGKSTSSTPPAESPDLEMKSSVAPDPSVAIAAEKKAKLAEARSAEAKAARASQEARAAKIAERAKARSEAKARGALVDDSQDEDPLGGQPDGEDPDLEAAEESAHESAPASPADDSRPSQNEAEARKNRAKPERVAEAREAEEKKEKEEKPDRPPPRPEPLKSTKGSKATSTPEPDRPDLQSIPPEEIVRKLRAASEATAPPEVAPLSNAEKSFAAAAAALRREPEPKPPASTPALAPTSASALAPAPRTRPPSEARTKLKNALDRESGVAESAELATFAQALLSAKEKRESREEAKRDRAERALSSKLDAERKRRGEAARDDAVSEEAEENSNQADSPGSKRKRSRLLREMLSAIDAKESDPDAKLDETDEEWNPTEYSGWHKARKKYGKIAFDEESSERVPEEMAAEGKIALRPAEDEEGPPVRLAFVGVLASELILHKAPAARAVTQVCEAVGIRTRGQAALWVRVSGTWTRFPALATPDPREGEAIQVFSLGQWEENAMGDGPDQILLRPIQATRTGRAPATLLLRGGRTPELSETQLEALVRALAGWAHELASGRIESAAPHSASKSSELI